MIKDAVSKQRMWPIVVDRERLPTFSHSVPSVFHRSRFCASGSHESMEPLSGHQAGSAGAFRRRSFAVHSAVHQSVEGG